MNIFTKFARLIKSIFSASTDTNAINETVEAKEEIESVEETPTPVIPENHGNITLRAEGHYETLVCKKCGKKYASIGLKDTGVCKECRELENFIGGPLGK